MNRKLMFILLFAVLPCMGCNHKGAGAPAGSDATNNDKAIASAIQAHLAHRGTLDMKAFDTQVKQVTYDGDHAKALVEFRVKKGPGVMQLTYQLEKHGGRWGVVESNPIGTDSSHPPVNQSQQQGPVALPHLLDQVLRGD